MALDDRDAAELQDLEDQSEDPTEEMGDTRPEGDVVFDGAAGAVGIGARATSGTDGGDNVGRGEGGAVNSPQVG